MAERRPRKSHGGKIIASGIIHTPHFGDRPPPPFPPPMAVAIEISQAEQEHQAAMRWRSYELAIERGHIRR